MSSKAMIQIKKLIHDYVTRDDEGNINGKVRALDNVSLDVKPGEFIAVLGHNGSGKSTLAKHLNALLFPSEGEVWVDGMETSDENQLWNIRQEAGMIFQNPDNQIIGQIVEEDVGFGPENLGVPTKEIWERVECRNSAGNHRTVFPADRSSAFLLPASLRCTPNASLWMSRLRCWIPPEEEK